MTGSASVLLVLAWTALQRAAEAGPDACRSSAGCKERGECNLDSVTGSCVPRTTGDCEGSSRCKQEAFCRFEKNSCVVDCPKSDLCILRGQCKTLPKVSACIAATDAMCQGSQNCKESGMCRSDGIACVVKSDADCKRATSCAKDKRCFVNVEASNDTVSECAVDPVDCGRLCDEDGQCNARDGKCWIDSSADCKKGRVCTDDGKCRFDLTSRVCRRTAEGCRTASMCKVHARCTFDGPTESCVRKSSADCRLADDCRTQGLCTFHEPSDACVAATDADCKDSEACKGTDRRCRADMGKCIFCAGRQRQMSHFPRHALVVFVGSASLTLGCTPDSSSPPALAPSPKPSSGKMPPIGGCDPGCYYNMRCLVMSDSPPEVKAKDCCKPVTKGAENCQGAMDQHFPVSE